MQHRQFACAPVDPSSMDTLEDRNIPRVPRRGGSAALAAPAVDPRDNQDPFKAPLGNPLSYRGRPWIRVIKCSYFACTPAVSGGAALAFASFAARCFFASTLAAAKVLLQDGWPASAG